MLGIKWNWDVVFLESEVKMIKKKGGLQYEFRICLVFFYFFFSSCSISLLTGTCAIPLLPPLLLALFDNVAPIDAADISRLCRKSSGEEIPKIARTVSRVSASCSESVEGNPLTGWLFSGRKASKGAVFEFSGGAPVDVEAIFISRACALYSLIRQKKREE